ncbi:uncharacterized protein LY79DRAFT_593600 [Colletotrichum navitas]|uniref:Methyltransferase domain-containing protein n=1 Tax=Colletotrichum navitas TaxID=681940 RepID=A0AAD8PQV8_9PEZI|nr:uncharacterized protein LY79DRAFT_593600 [Colletotrichum navitas]KAK1574013.1 hypothetical protein LY79DRAFT_593600 [Colletotrichum navitas]
MAMSSFLPYHPDILIAYDEATDSEADLESLRSKTTSVKISILEHRIENGRSYHKYNDGTSDMQHEICIVTFRDRSGLAPPCNNDAKVNRVLDIGTENSLWTIDYADQHPEAEKLVTKAYNNLTPGGYFKIQDNNITFVSDDGILTSEHPLAEFGRLIREAVEKLGRSFLPDSELKPLLVDVGFEDVTFEKFKWPSSPWPKDPHHKRIGE